MMKRTVVVRYQVRHDAAEENQRLVEKVYAELAATDPGGLRYATYRLADGVTFIHVATLAGEDNPLASTAAFAQFQEGLGDRCTEPPSPPTATVVGDNAGGTSGKPRARLHDPAAHDQDDEADGSRWVSAPSTVTHATKATITTTATAVTVPSPKPRPPPTLWGLPSQSATEAPSGRVST
jgi:hypothetical protein